MILWLLQICYLDTFYKRIKTKEAENLIAKITKVLKDKTDGAEQQIDALAAARYMTVFVTDTEGKTVYSAEYIPNARLETMPPEQAEWFYEQALACGGFMKVEFRGGLNKLLSSRRGLISQAEDGRKTENASLSQSESETEDMLEPVGISGGMHMSGYDGVIQNWGQEQAESVIYVSIVPTKNRDLILMVNTQLTPVEATVQTLRIELYWITIIMLLLSLGIAFFFFF